MSSHDTRRLNPGIQVDLLFPGISTFVSPRLVRADSEASFRSMISNVINTSGSNPNYAYALNNSGSFVKLTP